MCSVAAVLKYMKLGDAADCQTCLFHQYASGKVLGTMRLDECQNCSETLCGVLNSFVEHAKLLPGNAWDARRPLLATFCCGAILSVLLVSDLECPRLKPAPTQCHM